MGKIAILGWKMGKKTLQKRKMKETKGPSYKQTTSETTHQRPRNEQQAPQGTPTEAARLSAPPAANAASHSGEPVFQHTEQGVLCFQIVQD